MDYQSLLEFVRQHSGAGAAIARTRPAAGIWTNVKLEGSEFEGEGGYYGIGGTRQEITNISVVVTGKVKEGNPRPYAEVERALGAIADAINNAAAPAGVIHHWVEEFTFDISPEPADDQIVMGAALVKIRWRRA